MSMRLPLAPQTNEIPPAIRGEVIRGHVTMPSIFSHPMNESIGLFGDDATIPLVVPSGEDLHPTIPMVAPIKSVPLPTPPMPRDLFKVPETPTKMPFGMASLEKHGKKNVPIAFRG